MEPLNNIDVIILIGVALSMLVAFIRGFVKEVLSILGLALFVVLTVYLSPLLTPWMNQFIASKLMAQFVVFLLIMAVFYAIWIIGTDKLIAKIRTSTLSFMDRLFGLVFGFLRAVLILGFCFLIVKIVLPEELKDGSLKKSQYFMMAEPCSDMIEKMLPEDFIKNTMKSVEDINKADTDAKKKKEKEEQRKKEEEKKRKEEAEKERIRKEEAEKKRLAEERRKKEQAISNKVAGAFGIGSQEGNSQGDAGSGTGNQGSPFGNSDHGANEGVGGYGSFNLNGRSIGAGGLPRPAYTIQEEGRIVINITVDPKGNVIFAEIGKGTNIDNGSMRKSALDAAKRAKFNSISGANNQSGTITYLYKLK